MNREDLKIGKCYWVAARNLYDHTTYEVDKFELVSLDSGSSARCMCSFTRPKNWKANKDMSGFRRGYVINVDSIFVFESQQEAFKHSAERNWSLSKYAARVAIKYGG